MRTCCERCGLRRRLFAFRRMNSAKVVVEQRWFCLTCTIEVRDLVTHYQLHIESLLRNR